MAMQRGLYVLFGALAGYALYGTYAAFGFAAIIVNLLTPLPAAYVGMRCGSHFGVLTVVATLVMVLTSGEPGQSMMYLLQFGVPGATLPWLLNRGVAWDKTTLFVLCVMISGALLTLVLYAADAGQSPGALVDQMIDREIVQTEQLMQEMFAVADLPAEQSKEVAQAVEHMTAFLGKAYPGIVITVAGLMILGLILLLSLLARGRYRVPGPVFAEWKAPESLVWLLILAGFAVAFTDSFLAVVALNTLVVLLPMYFLQGLAVIDCFFRRKSFSPVVRAIGYLLVTIVNPLPMVVTGLGVFDLWADFRKPREPKS
jgi:uncharacterized protein YybS (DUF2232 family)